MASVCCLGWLPGSRAKESPSYDLSHGSLATLNTLSIAPKHHIIFQRVRSVSGSGVFENDADMAFAEGRSERKIVALPTGTPAEILDALKHLAAVTFPTHAARLPPGVSVTICIDNSPVGAPPGTLTLIELDDDASIEFFLNTVHSGADRRTASGLPAVLLFFSVAEAEPAAASVAEESELGARVEASDNSEVFSVMTAPDVVGFNAGLIQEHMKTAGDLCVRVFVVYHGRCMALSPDGCSLAVGCPEDSASVAVFDVASGAELYSLQALIDAGSNSTPRICDIAWSPDGRTLAAAKESSPPLLFSVPGLSKPTFNVIFKEHNIVGVYGNSHESFVAFNADGKLLATGSKGGRVIIWSTAGQNHVLAAGENLVCIEFSPNGNFLATGHGTSSNGVKIWDPVDGRCVKKLDVQHVYAFSWSPDNAKLVAVVFGGMRERVVKLVDIRTGQIVGIMDKLGDGRAIKWSPDGTMIAVGSGALVLVMQVDTGQVVNVKRTQEGYTMKSVESLAWTKDSTHVFALFSFMNAVILFRVPNFTDKLLL